MKVFVADPVADQQIPDLEIVGDAPIPGLESLKELENLFDEQASAIAAALHDSLPQGTWDRLIAEMVRLHASMLIRLPEGAV